MLGSVQGVEGFLFHQKPTSSIGRIRLEGPVVIITLISNFSSRVKDLLPQVSSPPHKPKNTRLMKCEIEFFKQLTFLIKLHHRFFFLAITVDV